MANYTGPDPNRMLPGEPWTADLALASFEDPVAIAQGAPGAPRVRGLGIMTAREYSELFPITVQEIGTGNFPSGTLPGYAFDGGFSTTTTPSTTYVSAGESTITTRATGTFRFSAVAVWVGGINPIRTQIRLLKNGTEIGAVSTSTSNDGGSNQTLTVDVAGAVGDVFEWEVRGLVSVNGRIESFVTSGEFDPIQTIAAPIKQSERRP